VANVSCFFSDNMITAVLCVLNTILSQSLHLMGSILGTHLGTL
jgi:hypothetical protein